MAGIDDALFSDVVWQQALAKFAAVTRLTVVVYGVDEAVVSGPIHPTPLFALFQKAGYQPRIFAECGRRCLAQALDRPAISLVSSYGLAVVGTSLVLEGEVVGAAVAGYTFVDFCHPSAVERLARDCGVPFQTVWDVARTTQPVPERRLILLGELLQVLGDALWEYRSRRQYQDTAAQLTEAAAAKDEFLAVLSHELRTPLTPILLWTRMVNRNSDAAVIERAMEVIERNAQLQMRLVDDLLDLSRATRGSITLDLQTRDLGAEVRIAVEALVETAQEEGVELLLAPVNQPLRINVDADRLQQILTNVLSNAIKFTPEGGRVEVTVGHDADAGVVHVRDTGEGIEVDFLPHVFEMFRQQDKGPGRRHSGLGIGLALVKQLTELHGGTVTVASEGTGRGTAVTVRLPLVPDADVPATGSPPSLAHHSGGDRRTPGSARGRHG